MGINKKTITGWMSVIAITFFVVGVVSGYTLFPNSETFKWLWRVLWLGVAPIVLFFSFRILTKKK